jgi:hypothetical protein
MGHFAGPLVGRPPVLLPAVLGGFALTEAAARKPLRVAVVPAVGVVATFGLLCDAMLKLPV